jgi:hypothetical protein
MPRVPVVTGPAVADSPLQSPAQRTSASPALLAGSGPQLLAEAGRAMMEVGAVIQEREDADSVMRAETALREQYLGWEAEAKQRRGQQAWGVAKDAGKWFDENAPKVGKDLGNDRQRFLFGQTAAKLRTQSLGTFSEFEQVQRRESLDQSAQASIVSAINLAAANPGNPQVLAAAKADIVTRNRARATLNGWAPELAEAKAAEYLTTFHKQVIQGLVRDNPSAAAAYFDANKGEIAGSEHAEIGAFAARATATRLGEQAADAAWTALGPKGDRDAVQPDVLEQRIRANPDLSDDARKVAVSALRERAVAFNDSRRERDDQLEASVNQAILNGAGPAQIRGMPSFLALSPESARKIMDYVENQALRREQVAAARASRAASDEVREQARLTRQGMGAYLLYSNPDTLRGMTEDQVVNLLPTLGNELTQHLMQQKRALARPGALAEAKIDDDTFKHYARQMKLPVDKPSQSEDDRAMLGELKYRVERVIEAAQQRAGKPLPPAEKEALIRTEMARTVTVSGWFSNTEVPVIALTPKQVQDVVIPPAARRELAADMATMFRRTKAPQYEPTEENLRRFYLLSRSPAGAMIPAGR